MKLVEGMAKVELLTTTSGWVHVGYVWCDNNGTERWGLDENVMLSDGTNAVRHRIVSPFETAPSGSDPDQDFKDACEDGMPSTTFTYYKHVQTASGGQTL